MMKRMAKMTTVAASSLLFLSTPINVQTQESASEAFNEVQNNIDLSYESVHATGTMDLKIANRDLAADIFQFDFDANFAVNPVAIDAEGSMQTAFFALDFIMLADDADAYFYQNADQTWTRPEFEPEEFEQFFNAYVENFEPQTIEEDISPVIDKYVNYTNENGQHIFQLLEDIDGYEFYQDLDEAIDIEATIIEQAEEARELADSDGSEGMTDAEFDLYVQESLDAMSPENFRLFFSMNPELQIAYNEDTYNIEQIIFNVFIDPSHYEGELSENDLFFIPEDMDFTFEVNFDEYGEEFEVEIPQEALMAPEPAENEYQY